MNQIPINADEVVTDKQALSSSVRIVGQIYKSKQNGMVYDPNGLAPCICVGRHSGVEPKIVEYEEDNTIR